MTVAELMNKLSQYDKDMEVKVIDEFGYWDDCNFIHHITTIDYDIDKDYIVLENR